MTRPLTAAAVLFLAAGAPGNLALAVDYYVSNTGDDTNTGLGPGNAEAFRTISHAVTVAGNGDRILVGAGTYDAAPGPGMESFPIAVPDGVEIAGPATGIAVVTSVTAATHTFTVGSNANTTILRGLQIAAPAGTPATGQCVLVSGLPADLQVLNNDFSTGLVAVGNINATASGGAAKITVSGNTMNTGGGVNWGILSGTAAHSLVITNNTMTLTGMGVILYGFTAATGDLKMTSNSCSGGSVGAAVLANVTGPGGGAVLTCRIQDNLFDSQSSTGILISSVVLQGSGSIAFDVKRNHARNGWVGMRLFISASGTTVTASQSGTIASNDFTGNSGFGAHFRAVASGGASATMTPLLRYNDFSGNGIGGFLAASAFGLATASQVATLRGNVITGNSGGGLGLATSESASGTAIMTADLGNSTTEGRNTLAGNTSSGFVDMGVTSLADTALTIPAEGNWWGASLSGSINALLYHSVNDPTVATIDFAPFCKTPLIFTVSPASIALAGGELVTVTANSASPFLAAAGSKALKVLLDGISVTNLVVAADGSSLSFVSPVGMTSSSPVLVVTNPGGQTGSIVMTTLQPSQDGCFIATAAFGDVEAPEVRILRQWRNECLAGNPLGRQVVAAYYALSPRLAAAVAPSPLARAASRAALAPVVGAVRLWMEAPWLCGLAGAALLLRLLRRRN